MPQIVDPKTGDIINVTGLARECPECLTLIEENFCGICGWEEGKEPEDEPREIDPETAKSKPSIIDHIDACNDLVCEICGGNKDEIDGILQCALCGTGEVEPEESSVPRVLPNLDDKVPDDPRCPKCVERAEALATAGNFEPHDIGEREMLVDYLTGAISLHCPVCDAEEEIWDAKRQIVEIVAKEEQPPQEVIAEVAEIPSVIEATDHPVKRGRGRPRKVV